MILGSKFNVDALRRQILLKLHELAIFRVVLEAVNLLGRLSAQQNTRVLDAGPFLALQLFDTTLLERACILYLKECRCLALLCWHVELI